MDLCSKRREEVIEFVYQRYGPDRVAMIATISRFRVRSALRETAKGIWPFPQNRSKVLVDKLPHRWFGSQNHTGYRESPYADLEPEFPGNEHQMIFRAAEKNYRPATPLIRPPRRNCNNPRAYDSHHTHPTSCQRDNNHTI